MDDVTKALMDAFPGTSDFVVLTSADFELIKSHIQPSAITYYRLDEIQCVPLVIDKEDDE